MARDVVAIVAPTLNAGTAIGAGTAINVSNGASVAAGGDTQGLLLRITNTHGADHIVTISAGDDPPAFQAGIGALAITVPATTGDLLIPLESARVCQNDGTILVDFVTDHAGKIYAIRLPSSVA